MPDFTEYVHNHKCMTCIHSSVCARHLGGANLDLACQDCADYLTNYYQPILKFWVIFDVPGFYNIVEYEATEVIYRQGQLVAIEGTAHGSWVTASEREFGKTVFFTKYGAKAALEKLIKEHNENG